MSNIEVTKEGRKKIMQTNMTVNDQSVTVKGLPDLESVTVKGLPDLKRYATHAESATVHHDFRTRPGSLYIQSERFRKFYDTSENGAKVYYVFSILESQNGRGPRRTPAGRQCLKCKLPQCEDEGCRWERFGACSIRRRP